MTLSESNKIIEYIETTLEGLDNIDLRNISMDYAPGDKVWVIGIRYVDANCLSKGIQSICFPEHKCRSGFIKRWINKNIIEANKKENKDGS